MREIEAARKIYESVPVPDELNKKMLEAVEKNRPGKEQERRIPMKQNNKKKHSIWKGCGIAVAACLVVAVVGLNTSESFAMAAQELPVIGGLAKVLTVRTYETKEGNVDIEAEVPAIVPEEKEEVDEDFVVDINAEIEKIVADYTEKSQQMFQEYKEAFLETGGTEEEWNERMLEAKVQYEIKYQQDNLLSLVVTGWQSAFNFASESYYYNVDLKEGKNLTLQDLLGDDWVTMANEQIQAQIAERSKDESNIFFDGSDGIEGFTTVDANTKFYINEAGNVVVVFAKYEIAPGYMGQQEFEIVK